MSQASDLGAIANQLAALYRARVNANIQALATQHYGATEPPMIYPNLLWFDSGTGSVKLRDPTNTNWWTVGTIGPPMKWTNVDIPQTAFTTGDVKQTFKTIADPGWVMMNDGSIGDGSSGATTRANPDMRSGSTSWGRPPTSPRTTRRPRRTGCARSSTATPRTSSMAPAPGPRLLTTLSAASSACRRAARSCCCSSHRDLSAFRPMPQARVSGPAPPPPARRCSPSRRTAAGPHRHRRRIRYHRHLSRQPDRLRRRRSAAHRCPSHRRWHARPHRHHPGRDAAVIGAGRSPAASPR